MLMTIKFISPYILCKRKVVSWVEIRKARGLGNFSVSPRLSSHISAVIPFQSVHKRSDGVEYFFGLATLTLKNSPQI